MPDIIFYRLCCSLTEITDRLEMGRSNKNEFFFATSQPSQLQQQNFVFEESDKSSGSLPIALYVRFTLEMSEEGDLFSINGFSYQNCWAI